MISRITLLSIIIVLVPIATTQGSSPNETTPSTAARIVQLTQTIGYLEGRIGDRAPDLSQNERSDELFRLLEHLGFPLPSSHLFPVDVTHAELASAIVSGLLPVRSDHRTREEERPRESMSSNVHKHQIVQLTRPQIPLSSPTRQTNRTTDQKTPARKADQETTIATQRLVERLHTRATRLINGQSGIEISVNELVVRSWRGLGLPSEKLPDDICIISREELTRALTENLNESDRRRLEDYVSVLVRNETI